MSNERESGNGAPKREGVGMQETGKQSRQPPKKETIELSDSGVWSGSMSEMRMTDDNVSPEHLEDVNAVHQENIMLEGTDEEDELYINTDRDPHREGADMVEMGDPHAFAIPHQHYSPQDEIHTQFPLNKKPWEILRETDYHLQYERDHPYGEENYPQQYMQPHNTYQEHTMPQRTAQLTKSAYTLEQVKKCSLFQKFLAGESKPKGSSKQVILSSASSPKQGRGRGRGEQTSGSPNEIGKEIGNRSYGKNMSEDIGAAYMTYGTVKSQKSVPSTQFHSFNQEYGESPGKGGKAHKSPDELRFEVHNEGSKIDMGGSPPVIDASNYRESKYSGIRSEEAPPSWTNTGVFPGEAGNMNKEQAPQGISQSANYPPGTVHVTPQGVFRGLGGLGSVGGMGGIGMPPTQTMGEGELKGYSQQIPAMGASTPYPPPWMGGVGQSVGNMGVGNMQDVQTLNAQLLGLIAYIQMGGPLPNLPPPHLLQQMGGGFGGGGTRAPGGYNPTYQPSETGTYTPRTKRDPKDSRDPSHRESLTPQPQSRSDPARQITLQLDFVQQRNQVLKDKLEIFRHEKEKDIKIFEAELSSKISIIDELNLQVENLMRENSQTKHEMTNFKNKDEEKLRRKEIEFNSKLHLISGENELLKQRLKDKELMKQEYARKEKEITLEHLTLQELHKTKEQILQTKSNEISELRRETERINHEVDKLRSREQRNRNKLDEKERHYQKISEDKEEIESKNRNLETRIEQQNSDNNKLQIQIAALTKQLGEHRTAYNQLQNDMNQLLGVTGLGNVEGYEYPTISGVGQATQGITSGNQGKSYQITALEETIREKYSPTPSGTAIRRSVTPDIATIGGYTQGGDNLNHTTMDYYRQAQIAQRHNKNKQMNSNMGELLSWTEERGKAEGGTKGEGRKREEGPGRIGAPATTTTTARSKHPKSHYSTPEAEGEALNTKMIQQRATFNLFTGQTYGGIPIPINKEDGTSSEQNSSRHRSPGIAREHEGYPPMYMGGEKKDGVILRTGGASTPDLKLLGDRRGSAGRDGTIYRYQPLSKGGGGSYSNTLPQGVLHNIELDAKYANKNKQLMSSEQIYQQKLQQINIIESNLAGLQAERQKLHNELNKMPERTRKIKEKKRKEELEMEMSILGGNINSLKQKLRGLQVLHLQ